MKSSYFLLLACLIVSLVSCNQIREAHYQDDEGHQIDEERYGNGNLKSRIFFLNTDKSDFVQTSYYEDGTLKDSMVFENNQLEGLKIYFDQTSGLTHYENYQAGVMQGVNEAVYDNGITSYSGYREKGYKAGEWIFHYPDGRPITYEFYDSTGRLLYFRKYDENGFYQQSDGSVILQAQLSNEQVSVGDTIFIKLLVAYPPGSKTHCEIKNLSEIQESIVFSKAIDKSRLQIPLQFDQSGNIKLDVYVEVKDNDEDHVESDQRTFNVTVI